MALRLNIGLKAIYEGLNAVNIPVSLLCNIWSLCYAAVPAKEVCLKPEILRLPWILNKDYGLEMRRNAASYKRKVVVQSKPLGWLSFHSLAEC